MNKKLLAMMAKRNELKNQAQGILDAAQKEERPLTDDERETLAGLKAKITQWDDTIREMTELLEDSTPVDVPVNQGDAPAGGGANKFSNLGEQLRAVYNAAQPNRPVIDERLMNAASGANESVPSDGGFLVQTDFAAELLKNAYETGLLAPRCRRIPISSGANGLKINALDDSSRANGARWGGIQTYWENEADQLVGSKPKFRTMDLSLKKLTGLCFATDELLQDAAALQSVISQGFSEEFGFRIDDAILSGSGSGQPLGVLKSSALVSVAIEDGQTEKLVVENIIKMWSRCWGRSRTNAVWYINQELEALLYTLQVGERPVYIPAGGLSESPYSTLFGRPIMPLEQCSAPGTVGDIMLADLSQYLLIDKGGINTASSIHVRFLYDENVFRFIYRVDGQPIWNKPITPYKGSNTGKIICGECGGWFGSKVWHSNDKYRRTVWRCNEKYKAKDEKNCSLPHIEEDAVKTAFVEAFNDIFIIKDEVLANLEKAIADTLMSDNLDERITALQTEVDTLESAIKALIDRNAASPLNQDDYLKEYTALSEPYQQKAAELGELAERRRTVEARKQACKMFLRTLRKQKDALAEFDEPLWNLLVESVTVHAGRLVFKFKNGMEVERSI